MHQEHSDIQKLEEIVKELRKKTDKKIILLKNNENVGQYENNIRLVEASSNDLLYVIDVDNVPQKNIDKTIKKILSINEKNYIYMPSKIYQFKNFYIFSKLLSLINKYFLVRYSKNDESITYEMVKDHFLNNTRYTIDKHLTWLMVMGNFFAYKSTFIKLVPSNYGRLNYVDMTAECMAICYFYLNNGGKIFLLKNFLSFS